MLLPNNACLISPQLIQNWPIYQWLHSAQDYAQADGGLHPAFELLAAQFGDHQVPVVVSDLQSDHDARNANSAGRYEDVSSSRAEMSLRDAISLMKQQAAFRNGPTGPHKLVYVKDWHLVREERLSTRVALNKWYGTPDIFQDDWMNNDRLPDVNSNRKQTSPTSPPDDFRFCYAGMKDTTTGLHQDVYGSYSWSTNIVGSKEWRLYDPRNAKLLLDYIESHQPDEDTFSQLNYETIEQPPGWTIFVPSNCFHTVRNREDTISINQNWCNSICLERMYNGLKVDMCKTADALHDVRDMMRSQDDTSWKVEFWRTVQLVNRSNTGWDWTTFWKMCVSWLEKPSCPVSGWVTFAGFAAS